MFGNQLGAFADGLVTFSGKVKGNVDPLAIQQAATATGYLADVAAKIPNSGLSFASVFVGDNQLDMFGNQLGAFADGLVTFSRKVKGNIDSLAIQQAVAATGYLVDLNNKIPNSGFSFASIFAGDNTLDMFGNQLSAFGTSLATFSGKVKGNIDPLAIQQAATATGYMVDISNALPEEGWFDNKVDLVDFGERLNTFGVDMKSFAGSVSGINAIQMSGVVGQLDDIVALAKGLDGVDVNKLGSFGDNLKKLGNSGIDGFIKAFTDAKSKVTDAVNSIVKAFSDGISSQSSKISSAGKSVMSKFVEGFKSNTIKSTVEAIVSKTALAAIKDKYTKFVEVGKATMTKFASGIKDKKAAVKDILKSTMDSLVTNVRGKYDAFKTAGKYLVQGFANGISENAFLAKAEAVAMAEAALEAAEEALGIQSPSREAYAIGDYFGMGFVNAVSDYKNKVHDSAYDMADYARQGMSNAISQINDSLNSDMDAQPTIRPVLDLSAVKSGVGAMNGLFDSSRSVGVLANVGAISSMMNQRQNGGNDDVVSAIETLSNKLGEMSGDTYNLGAVTYDDGSNVHNAVQSLVRAVRMERRR
jgi:hypothetical protein